MFRYDSLKKIMTENIQNENYQPKTGFILFCKENEILLNKKDLSLPQFPNIYMQGDAAGARGIYISALHGIYVAESLIN